MTVSKEEGFTYGVMGAGFGLGLAILVGGGTAVSLAGQPQALERFERIFYSKTLPILTVACAFACPATHLTIAALKKSYVAKRLDGETQAPQPQRQTTQFPTVHQQPVVSQPEPTPVQQQIVDLGQAVGSGTYIESLNGLFKADNNFGN